MSFELFLPNSALMTAGVETLFNALLNQSAAAQANLTRLRGKVLKLHLQELNLELFFAFSQRIDVLAGYEATPDASISIKLAQLAEIRAKQNLTELIKQDRLVVDGDLSLIQDFAEFMDELKPDVEELLSKLTGDVLAYQLVQGAKSTKNWLQDKAQVSQHKLAEAVVHEWQLAPAPLELAYFCDQVSDLAQDADKLEQAYQALVQRLEASFEHPSHQE